MKNAKHNPVNGWTGASYDASGLLRGAFEARMEADSPRDMVKN